jgi:DNA polymerase-3 subunit epsilon
MPLGNTGRSAFAHLLECARRDTVRLWAEGAPYDFKDSLKKRGYRWNDGNDGRPRSWYVEIDQGALDDELALLRREIYRSNVELYVQPLTAMTRFSSRM